MTRCIVMNGRRSSGLTCARRCAGHPVLAYCLAMVRLWCESTRWPTRFFSPANSGRSAGKSSSSPICPTVGASSANRSRGWPLGGSVDSLRRIDPVGQSAAELDWRARQAQPHADAPQLGSSTARLDGVMACSAWRRSLLSCLAVSGEVVEGSAMPSRRTRRRGSG